MYFLHVMSRQWLDAVSQAQRSCANQVIGYMKKTEKSADLEIIPAHDLEVLRCRCDNGFVDFEFGASTDLC